jgi:hypothetical protein
MISSERPIAERYASRTASAGFARVDPPVAVVALGPEVEGLAGDDDLEPVALVGEGEVPDESEAGPARRQHRAAQLVVGEAIQLTEHMLPLTGEEAKEKGSFRGVVHWHGRQAR